MRLVVSLKVLARVYGQDWVRQVSSERSITCPKTGCHMTLVRRGFVWELTLRGYAYDLSDEKACAEALGGRRVCRDPSGQGCPPGACNSCVMG